MSQLRDAVSRLRQLRAELGEHALSLPAAPLVELLAVLPDAFSEQRALMIGRLRNALLATNASLDTARLERVLAAMGRVERELFVPPEVCEFAYLPTALEIGRDQTISHPQIVAVMTYALAQPGLGSVLDVGTGSGYQAAVLSHLAKRVVSIEIIESLARAARDRLVATGCINVECLIGDACSARSTPDEQFDAIIVAARSPAIPEALLTKLAPGGVVVIPVGEGGVDQQVVVAERQSGGACRQSVLGPARFVPMTGIASEGGGTGTRARIPLRYAQVVTPEVEP